MSSVSPNSRNLGIRGSPVKVTPSKVETTFKMYDNFVTQEKFIVADLASIVGNKCKDLGRGSYGFVYSTSRGYAVKHISPSSDIGLHDYSIYNEIPILRYLNHPNIINVINMQLEPTKFSMPLALGTLPKKIDDIEERKWIFYQLFRGLAYCHSKNVLHRDIKPDNVLLFPGSFNGVGKSVAKLADFGISLPYSGNGKKDLDVTTLWWRAPEIVLGDEYYTELIDVWSLGVVLNDIIVGRNVFRRAEKSIDIVKISSRYILGALNNAVWPGVENLSGWSYVSNYVKSSGKINNPFGESTDPDEIDVLAKTIAWPGQRSAALEILELPYFDNSRGDVDIYIPADPIIIQSCANVMINEQITPPKKQYVEYTTQKRETILEWLREVASKFLMTDASLSYTVLLFDIFMSKHEPQIEKSKLWMYSLVCMYISSKLNEILTPGVTPKAINYILMAGRSFTKKQFDEALEIVLTTMDFNLIIPTTYNIIQEYMSGTDLTESDISDIFSIAYSIMLNNDYMTKYTQEEIARMSIYAAGFDSSCIRLIGESSIYTEEISEYLKANKL